MGIFTLMLNLRSFVTALALAAALSPVAYAASASKAFTVTNTGNGPLSISGAAISGNMAEYALTGNNCTNVAAGGSCALTVTFTPTGSGARAGASLNFTSNGTNGPSHSIALSGTGAPSEVTRTIAANASDVNMAALFGNPVAVGTYVLTINTGVYVSSSSTATAALSTGAFPAGSTVKIINHGSILGAGGKGGASTSSVQAGIPGGAGGAALALATAVTLDNASGFIFGGGGGGGSGSGTAICGQGGAGGGGAGMLGGAGGEGRTGICGFQAPGAGGTGGTVGGAAGLTVGSPGGAGGGYGLPGSTGGSGSYAGGSGGAGGAAVLRNGYSLTWLGGNNATQVKGVVQ